MIEQIGNYVKIGDRMIPAGNIQVEGFPGWKKSDADGLEYWYGIYFEIAFEDGSLWIVDQWSDAQLLNDMDDAICVATHATFGIDRKADIPDNAWLFNNWDEFLQHYVNHLDMMRHASANYFGG